MKKTKIKNECYIASKKSLAKDWLSEEDEKVWENL